MSHYDDYDHIPYDAMISAFIGSVDSAMAAEAELGGKAIANNALAVFLEELDGMAPITSMDLDDWSLETGE